MLTRGFTLICRCEQERKTPGMFEIDDKILRSLGITVMFPWCPRLTKLYTCSHPRSALDKAGGHIVNISSRDHTQDPRPKEAKIQIQRWLFSLLTFYGKNFFTLFKNSSEANIWYCSRVQIKSTISTQGKTGGKMQILQNTKTYNSAVKICSSHFPFLAVYHVPCPRDLVWYCQGSKQ